MGVGSQRHANTFWRLAQNRPGFAGKSKHPTGFQKMQMGHLCLIKRLALARQINHLPANHAVRSGSTRQGPNKISANTRIWMGILIGDHFKGLGQKRVARQDRRRLVKLLVAAWLTAAQVIIIHRWQIVMDQRIAVHHFNSSRDPKGRTARYLEQGCGTQHQKRAQAFTIAQG